MISVNEEGWKDSQQNLLYDGKVHSFLDGVPPPTQTHQAGVKPDPLGFHTHVKSATEEKSVNKTSGGSSKVSADQTTAKVRQQ